VTSLVHVPGELCKWCGIEHATTVVYSWPTCLVCASGGPKVRVQRSLKRWRSSAETRIEYDGR
jgi:hypothetical protein